MNDRFKFRAFYKNLPLYDDEKREYKKSFMIYNVVLYNDNEVETYVEDFEDQLTEQDFTEDEIEQVRDYINYSEYDIRVNFWANDVEQCTGIRDKKGNLIYEGDIVKAFGFKDSYTLVCKFRDGSFCLDHIDGRPYNFIHSVAPVEVIGNIHENKELLK